ncbi:MAG TPA: hypothetical protein VET85_02785, partial [Stellaceae bacterium]|nr:hypothetical protein [Stellaceae bacterium]
PPAAATLGPLTLDVGAGVDGVVTEIDCYRLARLARFAGAPSEKGAGIDLFKKPGDRVERGEPLYRIYACLPADFRAASDEAGEDTGFRISPVRAV